MTNDAAVAPSSLIINPSVQTPLLRMDSFINRPNPSLPIFPTKATRKPIFAISMAALAAHPPVYNASESTNSNLPLAGMVRTGLAMASATMTPTHTTSNMTVSLSIH
ncbi:hypothetical protein SDC9_209168 [bioreactor metagenome]|uniref:Uncharacterized protein n=1 Tax=bioreactor metagenome TaxID=1076179 RepID=A0A645JCP2_9ZZZZ